MKKTLLIVFFFCFSFLAFSQETDNSFSKSNLSFQISPNPSQYHLNIKLKDQSIKEVEVFVFNVLGKIIYRENFSGTRKTLNISNWKSGIYLVKITLENKTLTQRFIKQ